MAQVKLGDFIVDLSGDLPAVGTDAPDFLLVQGKTLKNVSLEDFRGKQLILNIFPTLNTPVCSSAAHKFNKIASDLDDTIVLCISRDLAWNQEQFCISNSLDNAVFLSDMRNENFGQDYGVLHTNGNFQGLLARSVVVIGKDNKIKYSQLVDSTGDEPDYEQLLANII